MSKNSAKTGLLSGGSSLDGRLCAGIGAELLRVRLARGLSVEQVAEKLLLSTRQVKALEQVEFAAFHNATFHLNALRKYAQFAEIDPALIAQVAADLVKPTTEPAAQSPDVEAAEFDSPRGRGPLALIAAAVILFVLGGAAYVAWNRVRVVRPAAAPQVATATPTPPPVSPPEMPREPAVISASEAPPAASASADVVTPRTPIVFGTLKVRHGTWIFVRDAEGAVTERTLGDGEAFDLETQPTYLAVGSPDADLTIGTTKVDVAKFVANGQIRIRAGDFDALVQGATPIPAPIAATP